MITLDEYKKYLINFCRYNIDKSEKYIKKRIENLSRCYSDELLIKIIEDTYKFADIICESDTIKFGYCDFDIEEDSVSGINLDIVGGGFSDTLYTILDGIIVSEYILEQIFGRKLQIFIKEEWIPFETNDDILSFNLKNILYLQGFPDNLIEKRDENNKVIIKK